MNQLNAKRLLIVDPNQVESLRVRHGYVDQLSDYFTGKEVLVINNASTFPASFKGVLKKNQAPLEIRLVRNLSKDWDQIGRWLAVTYGEGDWRTDTEERLPGPTLEVGDQIELRCGLDAQVARISPVSARLIEIHFLKEDPWESAYCAGAPIQYSHRDHDLGIWDVQTLFGGPAVAVEPPSAAFTMTWDLLNRLRKKGVQIVPITHSAGISSVGDSAIDSLLPFPENYWISEESAHLINEARKQNRPIIAMGTSVTRALESAALNNGNIQVGHGLAELKIKPGDELRVVSGIVTGMHETGSSHLELLQAFASKQLIDRSYSEASAQGYTWHEIGDSCLIYKSTIF